jgi:hypothetical protein
MKRAVLVGRAGLAIALTLTLSACWGTSGLFGARETDEARNYPANYKADIIAFIRTYVNDPTNIRDAAVSEPSFQQVGSEDRFVACLRFNAKGPGGSYAGVKDNLVIFAAGRLDRMMPAQNRCTGAAYEPFPELGRLTR